MKKIDVEKWNRRTNFKWFSSFTNPTFTVKTTDGVFNNAEFEYVNDYKEFYKRCREVVEKNNKETLNPDEYNSHRYDWFYSSCITTIELEGMTNH